jgi:hypothetical protein
MANANKNIVITPNVGAADDDPKIVFSGADATTDAQNITLTVYPSNNGTISFEGSAGQLFSITNDLSGTIFSVNDVSGIPSIEVEDTGTVKIAEYSGNLLIGTNTDDGVNKVQINGSIAASGFEGTLTGNAESASQLQTARTIALSGDVTGSASFDGSANATITATVADNSHNHTIANITGLQTALDGKKNSTWLTKTANYTASAGDQILADTTSSAFTITLPASPQAGASVVIADGNDWGVNNLTVARNGSTIEGTAEDVILDVQNITASFVYSGTTWALSTSAPVIQYASSTNAGVINIRVENDSLFIRTDGENA